MRAIAIVDEFLWYWKIKVLKKLALLFKLLKLSMMTPTNKLSTKNAPMIMKTTKKM